MKEMDRRSVITGIVCGAAVATFGLTVTVPHPTFGPHHSATGFSPFLA